VCCQAITRASVRRRSIVTTAGALTAPTSVMAGTTVEMEVTSESAVSCLSLSASIINYSFFTPKCNTNITNALAYTITKTLKQRNYR